MNPEIEPSIGAQFAKNEARIIAGLVKNGFGECRQELEKERAAERRNTPKQQPSVLEENTPQEIPKQ